MEIRDLLPIGSIVRLRDGTKKLMVFGVKQTSSEDSSLQSDYIGVLYPEGNMGPKFQYLFNHENVEEVFFRGFEDEERDEFMDVLTGIYEKKGEDA